MEWEEFTVYVQSKVQEKLGEEVQVGMTAVEKNNGVLVKGLTIAESSKKIAPTIYLEHFFEEYQRGADVESIVEELVAIYQEQEEATKRDMDFYRDFEKVKGQIACRLINYERNKELLKKIPHGRYLDLAVVYYYVLRDEVLGNGAILIYNSHLKMWGIEKEVLFGIGRKNTPQILPYEFVGMKSIMEGYFGEEIAEEAEEELPMYVLTNMDKSFGAVYILYDYILSRIGERLEGDFFILPSSIHECIIVPAYAGGTKRELECMVQEINQTQVLPEEILSDYVYFYERKNHRLMI